jgi:hypothetical protein
MSETLHFGNTNEQTAITVEETIKNLEIQLSSETKAIFEDILKILSNHPESISTVLMGIENNPALSNFRNELIQIAKKMEESDIQINKENFQKIIGEVGKWSPAALNLANTLAIMANIYSPDSIAFTSIALSTNAFLSKQSFEKGNNENGVLAGVYAFMFAFFLLKNNL